jgi:hypothetical protein
VEVREAGVSDADIEKLRTDKALLVPCLADRAPPQVGVTPTAPAACQLHLTE